jgi:hypothetical protein
MEIAIYAGMLVATGLIVGFGGWTMVDHWRRTRQ